MYMPIMERIKLKKKIFKIDNKEKMPIYIWNEDKDEFYIAQPKNSTENKKIKTPEMVREMCVIDDYSNGKEEGIRDYFVIGKKEFLAMMKLLEKLFIIEEI
jgi:5'-3' exonuclease